MDEEQLVIRLVGAIIDLYDDYSHMQYEEVRQLIHHKLFEVRTIFQNLMKIPLWEDLDRDELTITSSQLQGAVRFQYLVLKDLLKVTVGDAVKKSGKNTSSVYPDLKKIRSIISQVSDKSSHNQLIIITCNSLLELIEFYESRFFESEDNLVLILTESLTYEYKFHKRLNSELSIDPSIAVTPTFTIPDQIGPLAFQSSNKEFQLAYDEMLFQALSPPAIPLENRSHFVENRMKKIARLIVNIFKRASGTCYFFDIQLSIYINKACIDFVEVFCDEESKDLKVLIKEFFNKFPVVPELEFLLKDHHVMKSNAQQYPLLINKFNSGSTITEEPLSAENLNLVLPLLSRISSTFKRFELYERKLDGPESLKLKDSYYEFKFPEVFKNYMQLFTETYENKALTEDPYFCLVADEVLKYKGMDINPDCWDLSLHNLCKLMFGAGGEYKTLTTTVIHRLAVFSYSRSQSIKRKHLVLWDQMTIQRSEDRALLMLYEKTLKRRMMFLWVNKFIKLRSIQLQAVKYKSACTRNLAFSKWLNNSHNLIELNNIARKFFLNRYLILWEEKSSRLELHECYLSFLLERKRLYFQKIKMKYEQVHVFEDNAKKFAMMKFVNKLKQKNLSLHKTLQRHLVVVKRNYFFAWKNAFLIVGMKSVVEENNDKHLKKWIFNFWTQRSQERNICMQFKKIKDAEKLKSQLFSMLLLSENKQLARDFHKRRILREYLEKLKLGLILRTLKRLEEERLLKKYTHILKSAVRLSLVRGTKLDESKKYYFTIWRAKAFSMKEIRSKRLLELKSLLEEKFNISQQKIYLKFFTYRWEEATIRSLEKQSVLGDVYEKTAIKRYKGPFFHKWRSQLKMISEMNARAIKFDENIVYLNYLGVMEDKMEDVEYLSQLADELLEMRNLSQLTRVFKSWSLKALKVRSSKNLVHEFNRRSDFSALKSFFMLWKEASLERQLNGMGSDEMEDSISHSSMVYSPLLHRRLKTQASIIGFENAPSSTPLVERPVDSSFFSPRRRDHTDANRRRSIRTPMKTQTPKKFTSSLNSSILNSEIYRKNQVLEFRSRYQGLKPTPQKESFPNYTTAALPPAQPKFSDGLLDEQVGLDIKAEGMFPSTINFDGQSKDPLFASNSSNIHTRIRSLVNDDISSPKVSPVAVIRERMKNYPLKFPDISADSYRTDDDFLHTRSSSLTFVDSHPSEEREGDEVFGGFTNSRIPPPVSRNTLRNLRGRRDIGRVVDDSV